MGPHGDPSATQLFGTSAPTSTGAGHVGQGSNGPLRGCHRKVTNIRAFQINDLNFAFVRYFDNKDVIFLRFMVLSFGQRKGAMFSFPHLFA